MSKLKGLRRTEQNKSLFDYIEKQKGGKSDGVLDENEAKMLQDLLTRAAKHGANDIISQRELKNATNSGGMFEALQSLASQQEAIQKNNSYTEITNNSDGSTSTEFVTDHSHEQIIDRDGAQTYINNDGVSDTIYKNGSRIIDNKQEVIVSDTTTNLVTTYDKAEGFSFVDHPPDADNPNGFREVLAKDGSTASIIKHGEIGGKTADTWTNFGPDGKTIESVVIDYPYTTAVADNIRTVKTSYAPDGTETKYQTEAFVTDDNIMTGKQMQNGISIVKEYPNTASANAGDAPILTRTTTIKDGEIAQTVIQDNQGNVTITDAKGEVTKQKVTTGNGFTTTTTFGGVGKPGSVEIKDADGKPVTTMTVNIKKGDTFNDVINNIIEQYNLPSEDSFIREKVRAALIEQNYTDDNKGLCRQMKSGPNKGNYYFLTGQTANLGVDKLNSILEHDSKLWDLSAPIKTSNLTEPAKIDISQVKIGDVKIPETPEMIQRKNELIDKQYNLEHASKKQLLQLANQLEASGNIAVLDRVAVRLGMNGYQAEARGVSRTINNIKAQQAQDAAKAQQQAQLQAEAKAGGVPTLDKGQFADNLGFTPNSQYANLGTIELNGATLLVQANDGGKVTVHSDFGTQQFDSVKDMQKAINSGAEFFQDIGGENGSIADVNTYISQNKLGIDLPPKFNADDFPADLGFTAHPAHTSFGTIDAYGQKVLVKAGDNGSITAYKRDGDKLVSQKFNSIDEMQQELDDTHSGFFASIITSNEGGIGNINDVFIANNAAEPTLSTGGKTVTTPVDDGKTTVVDDKAATPPVKEEPVAEKPKPKKAAWRTMGTKPHPQGKWSRSTNPSQYQGLQGGTFADLVNVADTIPELKFLTSMDSTQRDAFEKILKAQNPSVFGPDGKIRRDANFSKLDIPDSKWLKEEYNINISQSNPNNPPGYGVLMTDPPQTSYRDYTSFNYNDLVRDRIDETMANSLGISVDEYRTLGTQIRQDSQQATQNYNKAVQAGKNFMSVRNNSLAALNDVNAQNIRGFLSQTQGVGKSCITKIIQCNGSDTDKKNAAIKLLTAAKNWNNGKINSQTIKSVTGQTITIDSLIADLQKPNIKLDYRMNEINRVFETLQSI